MLNATMVVLVTAIVSLNGNWNLKGWPLISDAVVDYYGRKKLAYDYICRAQRDVLAMVDENGDVLCRLPSLDWSVTGDRQVKEPAGPPVRRSRVRFAWRERAKTRRLARNENLV